MGVVAALNGSFGGRDKKVSIGPITTCFGVAGGGTVGGAEKEGGKKVVRAGWTIMGMMDARTGWREVDRFLAV